MPPSTSIYDQSPSAPRHAVKEGEIEYGFIGKLQGLKYEYRADIRDRAALERNFREKFEALNRVKLSDGEFARLLDEIVTPDVFTAAKTLRSINSFIDTYQFRKEDARYSRRVGMAEIEKNEFNLNISRYISTAVGEAEIDLNATQAELVEIEKAIAAAKDKHNTFLKELGLKLLP